MIEISNTDIVGWEAAIRGMRNPLNSWRNIDSYFTEHGTSVGENDLDLMKRLAAAGSDHAKYRRMITVYADLLAPLYFLKEWDTYKVGTVANSCSTMHKIHDKEFILADFSHEQLDDVSLSVLKSTIDHLNEMRLRYLRAKDNGADGFILKHYWWQMIQLLPSSYNQLRTIMVNYEVLANMYRSRRNHKLDEWRDLCEWIESLPYAEIITGGKENE